jgi:hypothetical protein
MNDSRFDLSDHFHALYDRAPRELALAAETPEEFQDWRQEVRVKAAALLGIESTSPPAAIDSAPVHTKDRGAFVEEKHALSVEQDVEAPVYLLIPKTEPPHRPVMVFHGHNLSIQPVLGHYDTQDQARANRGKDGNYAEALVRAGFLVCGVEQRGFGQRQSDKEGTSWSCRHQSLAYLMQGRTSIGMRCWDGMCAISWLLGRAETLNLQPGILGATGNSGGGTTTLWLTLLDERITCAVVGSYFCSFAASIRDQWHCECNYIPNVLNWGEMGDFAAAIAPRPVRFINGREDPIFPIVGTRQQFQTVDRAYQLLGAAGRADLAEHPGEHRYVHQLSHEWFDRWLGEA